MDHQEAVRLQAAEKYVLGELPTGEQEIFEEHYVDCPECLGDLEALGSFVTAGRMIFEEPEDSRAPVARREKEATRGWFAWLKPVIAVPAIAVLAVIVAYQGLIVIPRAEKRGASATSAAIYTSEFHLQGATRGDSQRTIVVGPNENFGVDFDFTPSQPASRYQGKLVNSAGQVMRTFELPGDQANRESHLFIPGGSLPAGSYDLVFVSGDPSTPSTLNSGEVFRLSFKVESRP